MLSDSSTCPCTHTVERSTISYTCCQGSTTCPAYTLALDTVPRSGLVMGIVRIGVDSLSTWSIIAAVKPSDSNLRMAMPRSAAHSSRVARDSSTRRSDMLPLAARLLRSPSKRLARSNSVAAFNRPSCRSSIS